MLLLVSLPWLARNQDFFQYLRNENKTADYTVLPFLGGVLLMPQYQDVSNFNWVNYLMILLTIVASVYFAKICNDYKQKREGKL